MRNVVKYLFLLELMILPTLFFVVPSIAESSTGGYLGLDKNGEHFIRIELSQWEIKAFDISSGSKTEEFQHRIGKFHEGATINFEVVSRDVQHGFSINELDISVASIRPTKGDDGKFQTFGNPTYASAVLPLGDITLSAFCHIFCGLGHPDMKLKFIIEEGSFESGPIVFYSAVALNVFIFGLVAYTIWNKRNKVVE